MSVKHILSSARRNYNPSVNHTKGRLRAHITPLSSPNSPNQVLQQMRMNEFVDNIEKYEKKRAKKASFLRAMMDVNLFSSSRYQSPALSSPSIVHSSSSKLLPGQLLSLGPSYIPSSAPLKIKLASTGPFLQRSFSYPSASLNALLQTDPLFSRTFGEFIERLKSKKLYFLHLFQHRSRKLIRFIILGSLLSVIFVYCSLLLATWYVRYLVRHSMDQITMQNGLSFIEYLHHNAPELYPEYFHCFDSEPEYSLSAIDTPTFGEFLFNSIFGSQEQKPAFPDAVPQAHRDQVSDYIVCEAHTPNTNVYLLIYYHALSTKDFLQSRKDVAKTIEQVPSLQHLQQSDVLKITKANATKILYCSLHKENGEVVELYNNLTRRKGETNKPLYTPSVSLGPNSNDALDDQTEETIEWINGFENSRAFVTSMLFTGSTSTPLSKNEDEKKLD